MVICWAKRLRRVAVVAMLAGALGIATMAHSAGLPMGTLTQLTLIPNQKLSAKTSRRTHSQLHVIATPSGKTARLVWDFNDVNLGPMVSVSKLNQQLQRMGIDTPARIASYPASGNSSAVVRIVVELPTALGNTISSSNTAESTDNTHVLTFNAATTTVSLPTASALPATSQVKPRANTNRRTSITFSSSAPAPQSTPKQTASSTTWQAPPNIVPTTTTTRVVSPAPAVTATQQGSQLQQHTNQNADRLQRQVAELSQQLTLAKQRLTHTQNENSTLASTVSQLKNKVSQAQAKAKTLEAQARQQTKVATVAAPIVKPAAQGSVSQQHLQALRAALEKSKTALSSSVATINQQNQAIQELKQQVAEMQQGVNVSSLDQQTYLDAELSKAQQHIKRLSQQLAQLSSNTEDAPIIAAPAVETKTTAEHFDDAAKDTGWVNLDIPKYTPFNHKAP